MKSFYPWCKFALALGLFIAALQVLVREWRPAPTGTVEITLNSTSGARLILQVNKNFLGKDTRERRDQTIFPVDFDQIVNVPIYTKELKKLTVEFSDFGGAMPAVLSARLLNRQKKEIWRSESSGPEWSMEKKIRLGTEFGRSEPRPWVLMSGGAFMLTAGGLLWYCSAFFRFRLVSNSLVYMGAIVCSLLAVAVAYWGAIQTLRHDVFTSDTYIHNTFVKKRAAASRFKSPRTIVVGGSSGLYGVDCSLLSHEGGQSAVNFSMHAGIPLRYYLDSARKYSKRGDSVILHLEFPYYTGGPVSAWLIDQSLGWGARESTPKIFEATPWLLLTHVPPDRIALGWMAKLFPGAFSSSDPVRVLVPESGEDWYYPTMEVGITEYGDLITSSLPESKIHAAPFYYLKNEVFNPDNEAMRLLADFIAEEQNKGVKIYFAFPPTILSDLSDFRSSQSRAWIDDLVRWMEAQGAVCLGRPEDYQQSIEMFRDTPYHLNPPGREIHTRRILQHLKATGWPGDVNHE